MAVSVSRNFGPLDETDLLTREDWGRIGRLARERLITRTVSGKDEDNRDFAPYSAGYAAQRASIGATTRPNLQLSGQMLQSITVEPDESGVTLAIL